MKNSTIRIMLLTSVCFLLAACPLVRGTGNAVEAVGEGVGDAASGVGNAVGQTGRELANDPMN